MFVLDEYHKAHHHYVKVVGTLYEVPQRWGKEDMFTYQMLPEVRRKEGREGGQTEWRIIFDLCFDATKGAKHFTPMDVLSPYHQMAVD